MNYKKNIDEMIKKFDDKMGGVEIEINNIKKENEEIIKLKNQNLIRNEIKEDEKEKKANIINNDSEEENEDYEEYEKEVV